MKVDKVLAILAGILFIIGAIIDALMWLTAPGIPLTLLLLMVITGFPFEMLQTFWYSTNLFIFVLGVLCFHYRENPSNHRVAYILVGVLGLIASGASVTFIGLLGLFSIIPSILAIIAGSIA